MSLADKIKLILQEKNLTPSIFADEINVQRSSVSHILAGRNRPSLEIVQKIVRRFPDLGLEWIMDDENFKLPGKQSEAANQLQKISYDAITPQAPTNPEHKKIDRILVFYSDGTFKEFISNI